MNRLDSFHYHERFIDIWEADQGVLYSMRPKIFEGYRKANNAEQAYEFGKHDVDSNGEAHGWRTENKPAPKEMRDALCPSDSQSTLNPPKSSTLKSIFGRVFRPR